MITAISILRLCRWAFTRSASANMVALSTGTIFCFFMRSTAKFDFGISVLPTECPVDVDGILLRSFPLAALVSGDRFLAGKQQVSIEDLRTGQLVLFSEEDSFNNRLIEEAAKEQVVYDVSPLRIRADSDMGFLLNRNLFSVRPLQHARRTTMSDAMRILPIVNGKGESVEIALYLIWHQSRLLSESDRTLIDVIVGMYRPV